MTALQLSTRDGRTLHAERAGDGTPTVVFESGMSASRNEWAAVVPLLTADMTTVAYDRSGLGRSPAAPGRRDLDQLAADLVDVLGQLGDGPFVLVGHSWGGPIVRVAATKVPERVAGLVLVDQTDETCDLFYGKAAARQTRVSAWLMPLLARLGIARLLVGRLARQLPEPAATNLRAEDGTLDAVRAGVAELEHHLADLERLRDEPLVLPDVPVTIISGTKDGFMERKRRPALVAAHRAAAAALPQGRHVAADRSSHYVPFTEPELVAAEIRRIAEASR